VVICLEQGADLHLAQLMPLPLTVSCFSKIQIGSTFLVPAHLSSPGKRAVKRMCVCVWSRAKKQVISGCRWIQKSRRRIIFRTLPHFGYSWQWELNNCSYLLNVNTGITKRLGLWDLSPQKIGCCAHHRHLLLLLSPKAVTLLSHRGWKSESTLALQ